MTSYGELFTVASVGELVAQPYESVGYWLITQSYRTLFPRLPEGSRHHWIIRDAEKLWAALALELLRALPEAELKIVDAKPLPVAKGKRAETCKCLEASTDLPSSLKTQRQTSRDKKRWSVGLKLCWWLNGVSKGV